MIQKPSSCLGCALQILGKGFMKMDGEGATGVMLVAEALGANEASSGKPLIGPAGFYFHRLLEKGGWNMRKDFYLANCIWCQPPDNKLAGMPYKAGALQHCTPNLAGAITGAKPRVLVAVGDTALERILGMRGIMECRGYVFWSEEFKCWVVPTLHPSFLMRGNHKWAPIVRSDVAKAVRIAQEGYSYEDLPMLEDPMPYRFMDWVAGALASGAPIAFDIETPMKKGRDEDDLDESDPSYIVLRCSFAYGTEPSHVCSIPWDPAYMPGVSQLFQSPQTKLVWNAPYDVPRVRHAGHVINGEIRDSQIAWHVLNSDLRKKLGMVATLCPSMHRVPMWKHLSSTRPAYYNALDSLALWRHDAWIMKRLVDVGMIHVYDEQVRAVDPVAAMMTAAGLLFDSEAAKKLSVQAKAAMEIILGEMQKAVPDEVKPKKIYKREREGLPTQEATAEIKVCSLCGKKSTKVHSHIKSGSGELVQRIVPTTVWVKTLDFTPSSQQLIKYCQHKGYKVPTSYKTKNATMDEDAITHLVGKNPTDPVLGSVVQYRAIQTADSRYICGMKPWADGRVHGTFTHAPSTLRMAMQDPTLQNIPRAEDDPEENDFLGKVKQLFVAGKGMILGARDYSGIEAVLVGYLMQDPLYIRLAFLGVHSYLTSHIIEKPADLSWDDGQLKAYFKEMKTHKKTYFSAKKTVHLSNYVGTPRKMHEAEPLVYPTIKEAERLQGIYYAICPSLPKWHWDTCTQAEKLGYIRTPDGFVHRFTNLFRYEYDEETKVWTNRNKHGDPMWGEDAKRAIAFGPQHLASMIMKIALVILGNDPVVSPWLRITVHDEIFWECPEEICDMIDARVAEVMERPCKYLPLNPSWGMGEYLSIKTEGKRGFSWATMK
jgi:uracil-DNA glycosylase family 4